MAGWFVRLCYVFLFAAAGLSSPHLLHAQGSGDTSTGAAAAPSVDTTPEHTPLFDNSLLPDVRTVYFPATGHHLSNRTGFLDYWNANGQMHTFGYPLTDEITVDGRIIQYFERVRLEYDPTITDPNWRIQPASLGHAAIDRLTPEYASYRLPAFTTDPGNGARFFPDTGHTLNGVFLTHWLQNGDEQVFGLPITEEFALPDGTVVQYFERVRFEYIGADKSDLLPTRYHVRVTDLGRQIAQRDDVNLAPVAQLAGTEAWEPANWVPVRWVAVNLSTQWLTAYAGEQAVYSAPVATGRDGFNTPPGTFSIYTKLSSQTMTGSAGDETWNVPNVPWVMYINGGVAMHGTYWHNAFGTGYRPSHGCINLSISDAAWLYGWADVGTPVTVHY